jgi:hypothetical protein
MAASTSAISISHVYPPPLGMVEAPWPVKSRAWIGPGLTGGGITPTSPYVASVDPATPVPPDPWALAELTRDPRPPDYATSFVRQAVHFSDLAEPITVCAIGRPAWLEAVVQEPGVRVASLAEALAAYGA